MGQHAKSDGLPLIGDSGRGQKAKCTLSIIRYTRVRDPQSLAPQGVQSLFFSNISVNECWRHAKRPCSFIRYTAVRTPQSLAAQRVQSLFLFNIFVKAITAPQVPRCQPLYVVCCAPGQSLSADQHTHRIADK